MFSVDVFFFVGGFLVAYAFLKETMNSLLKYPLAIINRYLRLVPAYFMAMMFFYQFLVHMGSGPLWQSGNTQLEYCKDMWKSLLFINNLTDGMNMCMGWGWYLQNDMQLFTYSILILLVYNRSKFASYMMIIWSILCSFGYFFIVTEVNSYHNTNHLSDF